MPDQQKSPVDQSGNNLVVYRSAPSEPDDDFWLDQPNKLIVDSLPGVRAAASSLMNALGMLQAIYLGILGFANLIPQTTGLWAKALLITPILCWIGAIYLCLKVAKTEELRFFRHSPVDIREKLSMVAKVQQRRLDLAFWCMFGGLVAGFLIVAIGTRMRL